MPTPHRRTPDATKAARAARERLAMTRLERLMEPMRAGAEERQRRLRAGLPVERIPE